MLLFHRPSDTAQGQSRLNPILGRLAPVALSFAMLFGSVAAVRAASDPAQYYASLAGAESFWALRVNDVTVWRDFEGGDTNLVLPINVFLQQGANKVDVTFVSVAGSPIQYNVYNPDFYFLTELRRINSGTRAEERFTVLNLALDQADNSVTFPEKTKFGLPVLARDEAPRVVDKAVVDKSRLVSGWGDDWTARRVTSVVQIDYPLPAPPWADAPVIDDTPENRARLLEAYRQLHKTIASGREADVRAAYEPAWAHLAKAMNYASVNEFVAKRSPMNDLAPKNAEGGVLEPLDLVMGASDFQVEIMANGRLARIVPDPIIWVDPNNPDAVSSTNVAFFVGADGALQVGAVLY